MNTKYLSIILLNIILLVYFIFPLSSFSNQSISGIITDIEGKRIEVITENKKTIWISVENSIPENYIGSSITGKYIAVGDTYILVESSINGQ